MALVMKKFIDVLTPEISSCPRFTVDVNEKYVSVTTVHGPMGVWGLGALLTRFQNRDNIRLLSIGMFMPENFAFTSMDFALYDNTLGTPAATGSGAKYTALTNSSNANGTWIAGHLYWDIGVNDWFDMNGRCPSPFLRLTLSATNTSFVAGNILPGYGSSSNGAFVLPFPNYELNLDLYSDICNNLLTAIPGDDYYIWQECFCPNVSMVGVPSDLDGRIMRIVPFIKIAHTCSIDIPVAP